MKSIFQYYKGVLFYLILSVGLFSCGSDDEVTVTPPDPPTITSIDPTSGPVGATITIAGTNFGTTTSDISVSFNGTSAVVTASTETSITTSVPDEATTGTIGVTIGATVVQGGPTFTVTLSPAPTITSYDPSSAEIGTTVTITGANFSTTPADNVVSFNGAIATITSSTDTELITTVPAGATTGTITITIDGQSGFGPEFTVIVPSAPVFTTVIASGVTVKLTKVQFVSANTAYIAGDDGTILKSTDAGATWTDLTANTEETSDFESLFFIDANTGWAIGDDGIVTKTTDGGSTWTSQTDNTGTTSTLRTIYFLDANNGYAGGSDGILIHTTDGGATWTTQTTGLETAGDRVYDLYFWNATNGIAVAGGGHVITTSDGGTTWALQADVNGVQESWKSVQFADANNGWINGSDGLIYKTINGGASWSAQTSPSDADFNGLTLIDNQTLVGVGDHNGAGDITSFVARTSDGGTTWDRIDHGLITVEADIELNGVASFDGSVIIAVGGDGIILK